MFSLGCFMLTFRHRHRNTALHSPVIAELPVERRAAVSVRGTAHSVLVDDRRRERRARVVGRERGFRKT